MPNVEVTSFARYCQWAFLIGDWMPLTHGHPKNPSDPVYLTRHVTNASVRETSGCPPVTSIIKTRRFRFFGHMARSDSRQDHHRADIACASLRPSCRGWVPQPTSRYPRLSFSWFVRVLASSVCVYACFAACASACLYLC